jgi:hypothetical protein
MGICSNRLRRFSFALWANFPVHEGLLRLDPDAGRFQIRRPFASEKKWSISQKTPQTIKRNAAPKPEAWGRR